MRKTERSSRELGPQRRDRASALSALLLARARRANRQSRASTTATRDRPRRRRVEKSDTDRLEQLAGVVSSRIRVVIGPRLGGSGYDNHLDRALASPASRARCSRKRSPSRIFSKLPAPVIGRTSRRATLAALRLGAVGGLRRPTDSPAPTGSGVWRFGRRGCACWVRAVTPPASPMGAALELAQAENLPRLLLRPHSEEPAHGMAGRQGRRRRVLAPVRARRGYGRKRNRPHPVV